MPAPGTVTGFWPRLAEVLEQHESGRIKDAELFVDGGPRRWLPGRLGGGEDDVVGLEQGRPSEGLGDLDGAVLEEPVNLCLSRSKAASRVCGAMSARPLSTRDTVGAETPASAAMSAIVTRPALTAHPSAGAPPPAPLRVTLPLPSRKLQRSDGQRSQPRHPTGSPKSAGGWRIRPRKRAHSSV